MESNSLMADLALPYGITDVKIGEFGGGGMLATDGHRFQQFQSWRLHWIYMRDPEIIEDELMEISAIADDSVKLERIIAWCAAHPDEVPFALHQMMQLMQRRGSAE